MPRPLRIAIGIPRRAPFYHRGMSPDFPAFALSEEHEALRASVRALADDKIAPRAAEVDQSGEFPWDVHEALAKAELTAVHIPEAYGGAGGNAPTTRSGIAGGWPGGAFATPLPAAFTIRSLSPFLCVAWGRAANGSLGLWPGAPRLCV